MSYITADEMKKTLDVRTTYQDRLYCRGFLITNNKVNNLSEYPFYNNWNEFTVNTDCESYYIYTQKYIKLYTYEDSQKVFFIIGHAYNPFSMKYDENEILKDLSDAFNENEEKYWDVESELTGVFCIGYIDKKDGNLTVSTDCAGMQMIYYGVINGKAYFTSHSKLVADFYNLEQPDYIKRLINNKFWHYFGNWLPGDLSPFKELKRLQPNCKNVYEKSKGSIYIERYFPKYKITETTTEEEYRNTIEELARVMSNNMTLIAQKWADQKVSISVTGGRDSMTTLACTNGNYDKYSYFSYISNYDESVDAYASKDILKALGLEHELFVIPDEWEGYKDLDVFKMIMECNSGCIGPNNKNDLKKRLYFSTNSPCDIEVKSWVNEIGRGRCYDRFNIKKFPDRVSPSYWRTLHKPYIYDFKLMKDTDKVFAEYLDKYYGNDEFEKLFWVVFYHWEFSWAGGEGVFLTAEQRVSNEITIPFNNRKYLNLMLTVPLEKRKVDSIPKDLIAYKNHKITDTQICVKDVSHTNFRAFIERIHLEVYSRIKFK